MAFSHLSFASCTWIWIAYRGTLFRSFFKDLFLDETVAALSPLTMATASRVSRLLSLSAPVSSRGEALVLFVMPRSSMRRRDRRPLSSLSPRPFLAFQIWCIVSSLGVISFSGRSLLTGMRLFSRPFPMQTLRRFSGHTTALVCERLVVLSYAVHHQQWCCILFEASRDPYILGYPSSTIVVSILPSSCK